MNYRTYFRRPSVLLTIAGVALLVVASAITYVVVRPSPGDQPVLTLGSGKSAQSQARGSSGFSYHRLTAPDRTQITDSSGHPVATMTDGARTVQLYGPLRTFEEPRYTAAKVETNVWARLAPQEWRAGAEHEKWFTDWLAAARNDRSPDALAIAMEYTDESPVKKDNQGQQYSGDASFGPLDPLDPDGRAEKSDFYDYLGVPWSFLDGKNVVPEPERVLALDCSGFLRMVYGHRLGYPLLGTNNPGEGLPRRAYAMAEVGPGVQLMPNSGQRARGLDRLLPGDLLFFNAGPVVGANIEHSGIYLGIDDSGHHRFISSRSQADGPTMGDLAGESILDGAGYWPDRWRTARRV
ncbi:NlpC/P60 family protein [Micromonospora sp. WMMD812]|uniref:NlpC/P60 family protein n=1 Tax=Micromonospora sp. WMMD812 TaxID=3015152 RepID=UPI00248B9D73|nr:NlpC/P60 family protein [Micromonospora sp. WMMD812]WBB68050.1 NlpC/P60 family protein [Micromonospora sp. WMMD812]